MRAAPSQHVAPHGALYVTNVSVAPPEALAVDAVAALPPTALAAEPRRASANGAAATSAKSAQALHTEVTRKSAIDAPMPAAEPAIEHLPTSALDVPPMPRSAPDEQYVEHVHRSGLPIQVRLYIDASGSVTETNLLGAAPGDEEAAEQVMVMFRETAFSPGRLQGREVASFIDIELVLEPTLPPLGRVVRQ